MVGEGDQGQVHSYAADAVKGNGGQGLRRGKLAPLWLCFTVARWWPFGEWEVQAELLCLFTAGGIILGW